MKLSSFELSMFFRSVAKRPGYSLSIVVTLGLTLGALAIAFNINYLLLLKPLPYPNGDKLVVPLFDYSSNDKFVVTSGSPPIPMLLHSYRNQSQFESMALIQRGKQVNLMNHSDQPRLTATYTTHEYGDLLGMKMSLGRYFNESEGLGSKRNVCVISHHVWRTYFSSEETVLGKLLDLNGQTFEVIGVVHEKFFPPQKKGGDVDLWLPWDFAAFQKNRINHWKAFINDIWGLGKIKNNYEYDQAENSFNNMTYSEFQRHDRDFLKFQANFLPISDYVLGDTNFIAVAFFISAFLLLIIAFVNLLNIFYTRVLEKERTFSIQASLGAKQKHLLNSIFVESMILTLIAAAFSLVISHIGYSLVRQHGGGYFKRLDELGFNYTTFFLTLSISIVIGCAFTLLSVRHIKYDSLIKHLNSGMKGSTIQVSKSSRRNLMVVQVSLAGIILGGLSISITKSLETIYRPLGLTLDNVYSAQLSYKIISKVDKEEKSSQIARNRALMINIKGKIDESPEVDSSALASFNVFFLSGSRATVIKTLDNIPVGTATTNTVSDTYFKSLKMSFIDGRGFSSEEFRQNSNLAVLSSSAASLFPKDYKLVGSIIKAGNNQSSYKVIGIVNDLYQPQREKDERVIYTPYQPEAQFRNMQIIIKSSNGNFDDIKDLVTKAARTFDPRLLVELESLDNQYKQKTYNIRILAAVAISFSIITLFLFVIGLYGIVNFSINIRKYEMGMRMALGAKNVDIIWLILRQTFQSVGLGLAISLTLALILRSILTIFEQDVTGISFDPFLYSIPLIFVCSFIAIVVPTLNLLRKNPLRSLRDE